MHLLAASELIVHVGDFTAAAVLEELRALAAVAAVYGNMDDAGLRGELPERLVVEAGETRIALVHDAGPPAGRHARLQGWFPDAAVIVYGHTHVPEVAKAGDTWVVNPGSPTERRRAPVHSMAVLDRGRPRLIELSR